MLRRSAFVVLCTLFGVALMGPAIAATSTTTVERIQVDFQAQGCGEMIQLSGSLLATLHATDLGDGRFVSTFHFNPQGVTGVGLTSGATYQGTGVTRGTVTLTVGSTTTTVNSFKLIGAGRTPNYLETDVMHLTVNAQGVVTASIDRSSITCH
jgi:hypothetical protein